MSEKGTFERRELEEAGWKPRGRGSKAIWRNPSDGCWYAHYQAVEMLQKEGPSAEEQRLLVERGFERAATDGTTEGRERWVKREEEPQRQYTRSQALLKARRGAS